MIDPLNLGPEPGTITKSDSGEFTMVNFLAPLKKALEKVQAEPQSAEDFNASMQACDELVLAFIQLQKDEFCARHVLYANTHRLVTYPKMKWEEGDYIISGGRIALIPKDLPYKPKEEDLQGSKYPSHLIVWMAQHKTEMTYWSQILHRDTSIQTVSMCEICGDRSDGPYNHTDCEERQARGESPQRI